MAVDQSKLDDAVSRSIELKGEYAGRNALFTEMEQMYFMEWAESAKVKKVYENVKLTLSPDPRNRLMGAVRLLVAGDPVIALPAELNENLGIDNADELETFADQMWKAAGKIAGTPIHYDAVLSGMLYGETHLAIISTLDLLNTRAGKASAYRARSEQTARRTPYLYRVYNPRDCYPEFDLEGLSAHYREVNTTYGQVRADYGELANHLTGKDATIATLCEWWDLEDHIVWVQGGAGRSTKKQGIISEPHGLPLIPIVVQITEGSPTLFSKTEEQRQPFLYTLAKSGMWNRQNLSLTVLYTMIFAMGANPMFLYRRNDPEKHLSVDWERYIAEIDVGEDFGPLLRQIIDPSLLQGLEIAEGKTEDSTIYAQALGEPLGKNAPFSMVALLHQAGRLPLVSPQRRLGWAFAKALEISFAWMKHEGKKRSARYAKVVQLDPNDIPDDLEFDVTLEISLPQDNLEAANVARLLTQGEDPVVSNEWVRQNILHIGNSSKMTKQIWNEKAANLRAMQYFADQAMLLQQKMQALTQPQLPPGMPPGGEGMPDEDMQEGLVGLPNEMAYGGGQQPMQPGPVTPPMPGGEEL